MHGNTPAIAACAPKLALLIPRLGSNHDGEVLATVGAIRRTLGSAGLDLHDLADTIRCGREFTAPTQAPVHDGPPDSVDRENWRQVVRWLTRHFEAVTGHSEAVTEWERRFIGSLGRFRKLSPKQLDVLAGILAKVREASHA